MRRKRLHFKTIEEVEGKTSEKTQWQSHAPSWGREEAEEAPGVSPTPRADSLLQEEGTNPSPGPPCHQLVWPLPALQHS